MLNFPNILTFLRTLLSPFLCFLILKEYYMPSFFLFFVLSFTDFFDGFLARIKNEVTEIGKILDPIADKILIFSVLSCFLKMNLLNVWAFIILLSRDFCISMLRIVLSKQDKMCTANVFGKIKTMSQMIFILLVLLSRGILNELISINLYCSIILWFSVMSSVISLVIHILTNKYEIIDKCFK